MTAPLVSVVVLTFNRPDAVVRCLESLAQQTFKTFEVVLVDVSTKPNEKGFSPHTDRLMLRHLKRINRGVLCAITDMAETPRETVKVQLLAILA